MGRSRQLSLISLLSLLAVGGVGGVASSSAPGPLLDPDTLSVAHRVELEAELSTLRAVVQREEQGWQVGETSMLRLSPDERRRRLIQQPWPQASGERTKKRARRGKPQTLPPRWDWRTAGGDFVSGVRDQGDCADGWIFAATAVLESAFLRAAGGGHLPDFDLSEQQALSCLDDYGLGRACEGGWPEDVFWLAQNVGLVEEACLPYAADAAQPCGELCTDAEARRFSFTGNDLICAAADLTAIKQALVERGPVLSTLSVDVGFLAYAGGVYRATGPVLGYHALTLIGFDDEEGCFIAKNSWGEGWGEAGFCRIAYDAGCSLGDWTRSAGFDTRSMGPYAAMEVSSRRAQSGETLTFRDRSLGVNAAINAWEWDFDGDGEPDATGPGAHRHRFEEAGRYVPVLTVADEQGRRSRRALAEAVVIVFDGPVWTVDVESGSPDGDGSSTHPFAAIQQALNAAASGDTVRVLPGRYRGPMNTELDNAGKALLLLASGEPREVLIDGEGATRLLRLDAAGTPVGSPPPEVRLEGFALEAGADPERGGGILAEGVDLTLEDCLIRGCVASRALGAGGAIWSSGGLHLRNCEFAGNRSTGDGGAVFVAGGSVDIDSCWFEENRAGGEGGALWQGGGVLAVARSSFIGNHAGLRGGALGLLGVSAGLDALRFADNAVSAEAGELRGGGGLAWEAPGADLLLNNCLFTGNAAPEGEPCARTVAVSASRS